MQTVVGLFRSVAEANEARQALNNEGYSSHVNMVDQSDSGYDSGYQSSSMAGTENSETTSGGTGVGEKIKHFFSGLVGHDEDTHRAYTEGVSRGGALLAVDVNAGEEDRVAALLEQYGASEIDGDDNNAQMGSGQGAGYGTSGSTNAMGTGTATLMGGDTGRSMGTGSSMGTDTGSSFGTGTGSSMGSGREMGTGTGSSMGNTTGNIVGEQVIPVVQEDLVVGKRAVQRGGVRVYSRVVNEPVSEQVSLHDESVVVDRRRVDRPATSADFTDAGPIEVIATGEEAVVGKTGRVIEEVVVGKTSSDRTETVEDSVRHTDVNVEQVGERTTGSRNNY